MGKRTTFKGATCPVARSMDVIGDWWSLLIVRDAFDGLRRFGEFEENLGIAKNILSTRLRNLVTHGILKIAPASDGSAYREYVLTKKGRGLFPVVVGLRQWGEDNLYRPGEAHSVMIDRRTGKRIRRLELRGSDGCVMEPEDACVRKIS